MDTNWLNHPALKNMHPMKKQVILDFMKESKGKNMQQGFAVMMKANEKLRAQGLAFTNEESDLLGNILISNLPPEQKMMAEMLKKRMNNSKK